MSDYAVLFLILFFLTPVWVYLCVKLARFGYLNATKQFHDDNNCVEKTPEKE